jgi:phosphoglycerol transferase MdoB-like AlkP superfamily enzyme
MHISWSEFWVVAHGMLFGAVYLLAFAGGFAGLWSLRSKLITAEGLAERLWRLKFGAWVMAIMSWLTVISGTYIVYPWYRAKPPAEIGTDVLQHFPRSYLLSDPNLAAWHTFGMEWKEHVAWLAPILATAVAYIITRYGPQLVHEEKLRRVLLVFFTLAFFAAAGAGLFGAFINKMAPIR